MNTANSKWLMTIGSLVVIVPVIVSTVSAGERPESNLNEGTAETYLKRSLSLSVEPKAYSTHLDTEIDLLHAVHPENAAIKEIYSADLRVSGDMIDIASISWIFRRGDPAPKPSYKVRSIWDGHQYLSSQQYLGNGMRQVQMSASLQPQLRNRLLADYSTAPFLSGVLTGDDHRILEIMEAAKTTRVVTDTEMVSAHKCVVLEAQSPSGLYRVWLDPDAGFGTRRATVIRGAGDLMFGKKLPFKAGKSTWVGMRAEIHDVHIDRIANLFVTVGATLDRTDEYDIGVERTRQTAKREHFEANPDFSKTDAFTMSAVPNGSPVWLMDKNDNMPYVWRSGKVVLDTNDEATSVTDRVIKEEREAAAAATRPSPRNAGESK